MPTPGGLSVVFLMAPSAPCQQAGPGRPPSGAFAPLSRSLHTVFPFLAFQALDGQVPRGPCQGVALYSEGRGKYHRGGTRLEVKSEGITATADHTRVPGAMARDQ